MKLSSIAAAVLLSSVVASSAQASQVAAELHGYVRSGTLWTANGMRNANRIGLRAGSEGYFRLGNEEDTKLELLPTIKWTADDGVWAKMRANLTHQTRDTSDWCAEAFDSKDGRGGIQVRETFIEMGGFEFNPSTVFWAGKRYSQMEISSHQYTYDYLQNNGTGGGFENMDIGFAKWDLGVYDYTIMGEGWNSNWSFENSKQGSPNELSVNTWLHAIGGTGLDIQLKYVDLDTFRPDYDYGETARYRESNQATSGLLVSVLYNTPGFFWFGNGYGKICFQYAKGADSGKRTGQNGYGWGNNKDQETTRLIVEGLWDITKNFSTSVFAMYQYDHALDEWNSAVPKSDFDDRFEGQYNKNANFYAIGVRPYHQITNHFAMQYELGYEHENHSGSGWGDGLKSASVFKATIAPTLTLDMGYWGRPQIRAFVTYAKWSKGAEQLTELDGKNTGSGVGGEGHDYKQGSMVLGGVDGFGQYKARYTDAWMVGFQGEAWF